MDIDITQHKLNLRMSFVDKKLSSRADVCAIAEQVILWIA